jgi:hypothetical protein
MGFILRGAIAALMFVATTINAFGEPSKRAWLTLVDAKETNVTGATAQSRVNIDVAALFAHRHGETRSVPVTPEKNLALTGLRVLVGQSGARTWVGMHREDDGDYNVFITENEGHVYGVFYGADTVYELSGDTNAGAVRLLDQRAAGYTLAPPTAQDYIDAPPLPPALAQANKLPDDPVAFATPAPQSVIDLLVVYTNAMVTRYGSEAGVLARINNLVAQANTAYLNSEVAITLRLVATYRSTYSETTTNAVALDAITPSIPSFNRTVITPPELAAVAPLRDSSQADIVVMIRPFRRNAHRSCGMANRNGTVGFDIAPYEGWAYAVFSDGLDLEAGNGTCPDTAFSHEIGHVMGMNHDRGSIAVEQPNATVPVVSYGHGFGYGYNAPGCVPFGSPGATCHMPTHGDIMSIAYVNRNLACYSNPQVRISTNGQSCGLNVTSGTIAGVAPDTPEESCIGSAAGCGAAAASCAANPSCAHATRALNYVRVNVSRWRDAAVSGTIQHGSSAVPSVSICTSNPEILCTASAGSYRCSGPAGWTGSIHPRAAGYRIPGVKIPNTLASNTSFNLSAQLDGAFPNCNLDVDGNGLLEAGNDGVAMLRRFMGFDSESFGALAAVCAQNATAASLYTASEKAAVAVIAAPSSNATSDGLVLLRAMLGLTGTAVTQGAIANGALRSQWSVPAGANNNIREWLNANCGTTFAQ